jgi:energy-coupling factor transport system permease protein
LSALAILLTLLSLPQLIGGLYTLAYPLRWIGLSRERVAVRLALTLEYAESAMSNTVSDWKSSIGNALQPTIAGTSHIELRQQAFGMVDVLLLLSSVAVLVGVWK